MAWTAVSVLVLAPFAGVLLWAITMRHVTLAPGTAAIGITTAADAAPVLGWARWVRAPGPPGREVVWRASAEIGAVALASWAIVTQPPELVWPACALGWLLLAAAMIDVRERLLPDEINLAIGVLGLAHSALPEGRSLLDAVLGVGIGFAALAGFAFLYARLRGREGLGLGDAKLLAALGAWVGWQGLAGVVMVGSAAGLAWALLDALARRRRLRGDLSLPLGPFLALGGWLTWLYGPIGLAGPP
jgi:leader peptidase (prepilin peptidase)/N-methyltransferase